MEEINEMKALITFMLANKHGIVKNIFKEQNFKLILDEGKTEVNMEAEINEHVENKFEYL
jgi:hypothetical protein